MTLSFKPSSGHWGAEVVARRISEEPRALNRHIRSFREQGTLPEYPKQQGPCYQDPGIRHPIFSNTPICFLKIKLLQWFPASTFHMVHIICSVLYVVYIHYLLHIVYCILYVIKLYFLLNVVLSSIACSMCQHVSSANDLHLPSLIYDLAHITYFTRYITYYIVLYIVYCTDCLLHIAVHSTYLMLCRCIFVT